MMRFDVITLFPEIFAPFLSCGVTRRAFNESVLDVRLHQLRDFAQGVHRQVDDRPYGGGPGMVMQAEPLEKCLHQIFEERVTKEIPVIFFSPTGKRLTHDKVSQFATGAGGVLICGRYEGVDQRFIDRYVTEEVSIGDFVLSGGEIPAMAFLDSVARLQAGVLGDELSSVQDSFAAGHDGLLDYPHFTRPEKITWKDGGEEACAEVPEVLLSGNHAMIQRWRREKQLQLTASRRPDLIEKALECGVLDQKDRDFLKKIGYNSLL